MISGDENVIKPDPRIFRVLVDRYGLEPGSTVFVDDHEPNIRAAAELGFRGIQFVDADALRVELRALGLPIAAAAGTVAPR